MTEWGVVIVIIALAGLLATIAKPVISLTGSITRLTAAVDRLDEKMDVLTNRNNKAHDTLFEATRAQGETLAVHDHRLDDHERRLGKIEATE